MTPDEKRELFRVLNNNPHFLRWLAAEEADVVKSLKAAEGNTFLRYQGKAALIDEMKRLLAAK